MESDNFFIHVVFINYDFSNQMFEETEILQHKKPLNRSLIRINCCNQKLQALKPGLSPMKIDWRSLTRGRLHTVILRINVLQRATEKDKSNEHLLRY